MKEIINRRWSDRDAHASTAPAVAPAKRECNGFSFLEVISSKESASIQMLEVDMSKRVRVASDSDAEVKSNQELDSI